MIVGQHSKPIVHFVIQAPNLAQMYTNILRTFSDIGPLGILSVCPPYWILKWRLYITWPFLDLHLSLSCFYRAMLCIRGTSHGPVSVRLSAQVGVLLKRLNEESHKQHHTIVQGLQFSDAKDLREIRPGSPPTRAPNAGGVIKIGDFRQIAGYISKTVQDGA